MSNFLAGLIRGLKGQKMPDETPPSLEDLLRAHVVTLQQCDVALGQCIEVACKVLEQVRAPLGDPTVPPPVEVPWVPANDPNLLPAPVGFVDPGAVLPGAQIELPPSAVLSLPEELQAQNNGLTAIDPTPYEVPVVVDAVPQGIRYEGDVPFNQGHTAVIKYE